MSRTSLVSLLGIPGLASSAVPHSLNKVVWPFPRLSTCSAAFVLSLLAPIPTFADAISLNVLDPFRFASTNSTEIFSGTITNDTLSPLNATDFFVNFADFDPTVVTLTQLLGLVDFTLAPGTTSAPVDLFSFGLGPTAVVNQTYLAAVQLEDVNNDLSNVVTVGETVIPEPNISLLATVLAAGLGLAHYTGRHRRQ